MPSSPSPPQARADWAYFLDFDGTLVDLAQTPDAVEVTREISDALAELYERTGGAVAIISGRSVGDLDRHLGPLRFPTAGLHGLERRFTRDGETEPLPLPDRLLDQPREVAAQLSAIDGILVEDKGPAIAVHYRRAPHASELVMEQMSEAVADNRNLKLLTGKMVVEVKPVHADKGTAVTEFLSHRPFAGRKPCFIGDDVTDEDGFRACLPTDGCTIKIGDSIDGSAASACLPSPSALLSWLRDIT